MDAEAHLDQPSRGRGPDGRLRPGPHAEGDAGDGEVGPLVYGVRPSCSAIRALAGARQGVTLNILLGLALAIAIEVPVVLVFAWQLRGRSELGSWLLLALGANTISYPLFFLGLEAARPLLGDPVSLGLLETLVVGLEGGIYAKAGGARWGVGLGISAAANAMSFAAGLVLS